MNLVKNLTLSALTIALLAGCNATPKQGRTTQSGVVSNNASNTVIAKSAYVFEDEDITMPALL
ncbi:hypothetical protein LOC50_16170 [Pseudoalteromonas sp. SCSIO 43095]|uniref:hypothetical protein n=1 Tax=Pseudoalteromonas sp. SCSIO 43095 TaxID=2894202 RepID=UPI00202B4540|nr:hypothetical protein [Pseudoalteromonas sp. SCSIO 43095]URR00204.1 hypothetical protein LOC50_16170 [Pseudoalteromonas sp. SCSIO 43095]